MDCQRLIMPAAEKTAMRAIAPSVCSRRTRRPWTRFVTPWARPCRRRRRRGAGARREPRPASPRKEERPVDRILEHVIPPKAGYGLVVARGHQLRIIDLEGKQ